MQKTTPKVLIGLPTMSSIHIQLAVVIMYWLVQSLQNKDKSISVYPTISVQPVDNARNQIVEAFLEGDYTHLFFIDSDTIPPRDALDKLLAHDKDVISGITPIIDHDEGRQNDSSGFYKKWNCVNELDQHVKPNTGVVKVKGAGGSCILIKRHVFEQLEKPYYRFLYQDDNGKPVVVSEDIYFVAKALGKGITTYADTSIICQHYKPIIW